MTALLDRYLSFHGRLARMPFLIRNSYLGLVGMVLAFASIPLFSNGSRALWWVGLAYLIFVIAFIAVGMVSLIVRRLHDLGLSGYHAVWVGGAQLGWVALSHAPADTLVLGLPLCGIGLWLLFFPGNPRANRFGR